MTADKAILDALDTAASKEQCRVLFAVESGSRAWGFASPDSDYDVRFVYAMPLEWHLSVREKKDTIQEELPGDLDLSGWEIRKALTLFAGCNLAFNEWLGSPVIYADREGWRSQLQGLIPTFLNIRKGMFHYLSIADQQFQRLDAHDQIGIKKLFYLLRPVHAAYWLHERREMPPTDFHAMRRCGYVPGIFEEIIDDFLEQKKSAMEADAVTLPPAFAEWLRISRAELETAAQTTPARTGVDMQPLDEILRRVVLNAK